MVVKGKGRAPLGTTGLQPYLQQARSPRAEIIIMNLSAAERANAMRKLIVILNAILRTGSPWRATEIAA